MSEDGRMRTGEDGSNPRDAIARGTQPRNKLGNRRSKDDQVPTSVWSNT